MVGTPKPQLSLTRVTVIDMTDRGSRAGNLLFHCSDSGEAGVITLPLPWRRMILGGPVKAQEHQHDSAVLAEVGDSLRAAARYIQVGDLAGPEYSKAVKALWRSVHVPILGERAPLQQRTRAAGESSSRVQVRSNRRLCPCESCAGSNCES